MKTRTNIMIVAGLLAGGAGAALMDTSFEDHVVATEIAIKDSAITAWDTQSITTLPDIRQVTYWGPDSGVAHDGDQVCHLGGQTVFQNVSDTYVEGVTYIFSYYAYNDYANGTTALNTWNYFTDASGTGQYGGATLGGQGKVTVTQQQQWVLVTSSYTAKAADAGKNIGVGVAGPLAMYIDDAALIPEPATLSLLGGIGVSMLFIRRKLMI